MEYRRLGRSELNVSVIGVGTAQYRMIPEQQAIETLTEAFRQGVNIVHTAPDYEGTLDLVAKAVRKSNRDIIVCNQGHGNWNTMESVFRETCTKLGKSSLDMFGIACIDDRELSGENVWGPGGQIDFLQTQKRAGNIKGLFCSTHGSVEYVKKLIEADVFDAILLAFNVLGYHLLSYNQKDRQIKERLYENEQILRLAAEADIGLMIMKPLAGGLLCQGKAFPAQSNLIPQSALSAKNILRHLLLQYPHISCVVPGTASPEEARENALAGHNLSQLNEEKLAIEANVNYLKATVCNRCGNCEESCSKRLPISWIVRAAYVQHTGSMVFETLDRLQYRSIHPWETASCVACEEKSCCCPIGIDIPDLLCRIHDAMSIWEQKGWIPTVDILSPIEPVREFDARLFAHNLPQKLNTSMDYFATIIIKNLSCSTWDPAKQAYHLTVTCQGRRLARTSLRGAIVPGENAHFSFVLTLADGMSGEIVFLLERGKTQVENASLTNQLLQLFKSEQKTDAMGIFSLKIASGKKEES